MSLKTGINNYLQLALVVCLIIVSISVAGCGDDHKGHDHGDMNMETEQSSYQLSMVE